MMKRDKQLYWQTRIVNVNSIRVMEIFNNIKREAAKRDNLIYSHEKTYDGMGRFMRNYLDIPVKILVENEIKYSYICRFKCLKDIELTEIYHSYNYKLSDRND